MHGDPVPQDTTAEEGVSQDKARGAADEDDDGHEGHDDYAAPFRHRFWVTLALSVSVVIGASMIQD